jgi:hypothetical protein
MASELPNLLLPAGLQAYVRAGGTRLSADRSDPNCPRDRSDLNADRPFAVVLRARDHGSGLADQHRGQQVAVAELHHCAGDRIVPGDAGDPPGDVFPPGVGDQGREALSVDPIVLERCLCVRAELRPSSVACSPGCCLEEPLDTGTAQAVAVVGPEATARNQCDQDDGQGPQLWAPPPRVTTSPET